MERDLAEIDQALGKDRASDWLARAEARKARIESLLWDEAPASTSTTTSSAAAATPTRSRRRSGRCGPGSRRPRTRAACATTCRCSSARAGSLTSTRVTGAQWDAPFGWAPLQLFAVSGLRRYGFDADADRIARAWLSMLVEDFERRGTLVEKYDVERRTSDVAGRLAFGYTEQRDRLRLDQRRRAGAARDRR